MLAKPWDKHREMITKLYIQERRTLEDMRGIMKTRHNFEASIRSYRQHFAIWGIRKYNCEKRQQRRRQSLKRTILPSPLRSPPALSSSSETSDPGSSPASSCARQRSPKQLPLPAIEQLPVLQSPLPETRIKIESGGGETSRTEVPTNPSAASSPESAAIVRDSLIPHKSQKASQMARGTHPFRRYVYCAHADSAYWSVYRAAPPPSSAPTPRMTTAGHLYGSWLTPPDMARWHQVRMPPNMSVVRGMVGPWCLASP